MGVKQKLTVSVHNYQDIYLYKVHITSA